MKRRNWLFSILGLATAAAAPAKADPEYDVLQKDWARFADAMNKYVEGLRNNVNDYDSLRKGVHAWRRMEKDMQWDKL